MDIKCIALDLDRTTLNAQGKLSEGNRQALSHAIEKGVPFTHFRKTSCPFPALSTP